MAVGAEGVTTEEVLPVAGPGLRPAWAEVDLEAIAYNARVLTERAHPARMCVVVKADGYGHGAIPVAKAVLAGGAGWLGVALVEEGIALREAGVAAPILMLSEPDLPAMVDVVRHRLTPTIYTRDGLAAAAAAAAWAETVLPVHLKVDTGMHRVGAAPADALALAGAVVESPSLELDGVYTHLAVADEVANSYTGDQLAAYERVLADLSRVGIRPRLRHAANSAATLWHPAAHYDLVRCGIAVYGLAPCTDGLDDPTVTTLRPALSLRARVSHVKTLDAGARVSYGLRYQLARRSVVATVPLGYADGIPRRYGLAGGQVLISGRRRPVVGTVTMDQLLVDCGPDADVGVGDEVVLIGRQGDEAWSAWDWASLMDTISYEVVCGLTPRVPRVYRPASMPAQ
jgi:alanine racemase